MKVGYLVHSDDDPADPDPQGENLWAGTRGYYGPEAMVGLWVEEKKDYKPASSRTTASAAISTGSRITPR